MWTLDLAPHLAVDGKSAWERTPRKGQAPSERAGSVMCVYKNRLVQFGGVFDGKDALSEKTAAYDGKNTGKSATAKPVWYNDLFAFDLEHRRWYDMPLRRKEAPGKRRRKAKGAALSPGGAESEDDEDEGGEAKEEVGEAEDPRRSAPWNTSGSIFGRSNSGPGPFPLVAVAREVHSAGFGWMIDELAGDEDGGAPWWGGGDEEQTLSFGDPWVTAQPHRAGLSSGEGGGGVFQQTRAQAEAAGPEASLEVAPPSDPCAALPIGRLNPCVLLKGHTMIVYGGTFEHGNREWALDDCWAIDLRDREEWTRLIAGTPHSFDDADSSDDDDDEDDDELEEARGEDGASGSESGDEDSEAASAARVAEKRRQKLSVKEEMAELRHLHGVDDELRTPKNGEALRDFFVRTSAHWSAAAEEAYEVTSSTALVCATSHLLICPRCRERKRRWTRRDCDGSPSRSHRSASSCWRHILAASMSSSDSRGRASRRVGGLRAAEEAGEAFEQEVTQRKPPSGNQRQKAEAQQGTRQEWR